MIDLSSSPPRLSSWRKVIKLLPDYFYLSIVRSSEFKFSFYSYLFLYITQIAFYITFWNLVKPPTIEGWSMEACFLLTGFATLNIALQEIIWATGMIDQMILQGDLTVVLVRPENSYFGLVLRRMGAMAVIPAFLGLLVVLITLIMYFEFHLLQLALACSLCVLGAVCMRALMLSVNSLGFKYGRVTALKSFVLSGRDLSRYPLSLLPSGLKTFLATLFPVLLVSNWPAKLFLLENVVDMLVLFVCALLVTVAWVSFAAYVWRRGLRSYEGQSL
jgi:ABC-type uncharacterized transport system permease subunit